MARLKLHYKSLKDLDGTPFDSLVGKEFESFNTEMLGLGTISQHAKSLDGLAAVFDLEGFTSFCNQADPHLVVPGYLQEFLTWLFREIREAFTYEVRGDDVLLWARLPFFAKFTGDGILLLWDTGTTDDPAEYGNIILGLIDICDKYQRKFVPLHSAEFARLPKRLRCGAARGRIISVGHGADYVGSCINMAARLQKVGHLSFAFSQRGFSVRQCFDRKRHGDFLAKKVAVRGIGYEEIILVRRREFEKLPAAARKAFRDP